MTPDAHYGLAKHLRQMSRAHTCVAPQPDWSIVMLFYSALHVTQAYLLTKQHRFHADDHGSRKRAIIASPELSRAFLDSYTYLQDLSVDVRYNPQYTLALKTKTQSESSYLTIVTFVEAPVRRALNMPTGSDLR